MPIYEYLCNTCSKRFEVVQAHPNTPSCRHCGEERNIERLWSSAAFALKGKGFHKNDYGKHGPR
jgi:putative FmdB family regulatory protein